MDNVLINFVGNVAELKPAENALDSIIQKDSELGQKWAKTSEIINQQNKANTESSNKLAKSIDAIATAAKSMDKAVIGGAYKEYLKQIQTQLGLTSKELISYIQNAKKAAQAEIFAAQSDEEIQQLTLSIEVMNDQLREMGVNIDDTGEKTNTLISRIRNMTDELKEMRVAGKEGTEEYEKLRSELVQLQQQSQNTNKELKVLGSDTKSIDGLISVASGVAGGFAVAQGTAALFGDESEDVQKALLKVNAAMSILQGLQQVQIVLQKESAASLLLTSIFYKQKTVAVVENTVATGANAVATEAVVVAEGQQVVATQAATVAQVELNTAMSLNPVALIIAGIIALVGIIAIWKSGTSDQADEQDKLNRAIKESTDHLDNYLNAIEHLAAKELALAKQRGASFVELAKGEINAGKSRLDSIDAARVAAAKAYNESKADDEEGYKAKQKLFERITELQVQYQDEKNKLEIRAIELTTQLQAEELKSFIGFQQAKLAATVAGSDNERTVQIGTIRAISEEREKSADFIALTEGEKAAKRAEDERTIRGLELQNYQHYLKGRTALYDSYIAESKLRLIKNNTDTIASITEITDYEIAALRKRRDEALKSDPNLNGGETRKIIAETNLQIAQLEKEKQLKILDIQKSGINAQLIASEEGSLQQFNNRILFIEKEQEIELAATELSENKIAEIRAKYAKQREETERAFQVTQLQNQISYLNADLETFGINENAKLIIVLDRLDKQRELEILQAEGNAAKIAEITAKYDKQIIDSKKATYKAILDSNLKTLDTFGSITKAANERILASDKSTFDQKKQANADLLTEELRRIDLEKANLVKQLQDQVITQEEYNLAVADLSNKRSETTIASEERTTALVLAEITKRTVGFQTIMSVFNKGLQATVGDTGFATAITQLEDFAVKSQDVFAKLKEGTITQAEAIKEIATAAIAATQEITNKLFADGAAQRQQALEETIAGLEEQKEKELSAKNLTEQQKIDIENKYREKEKQAKLQAWLADKEAKKEQAVINGLLAVAQTFATFGWPAGIIPAAIMGSLALATVAQISNSKPPKFRHGVVDLQGPGTGTSDSIPAMLSKGESVIPAEPTAKWKDALLALKDNKFENYLSKMISDFVFPDMPDHIIVASGGGMQIDYDKLGKTIAKEIPDPVKITNVMDGEGVHSFVTRGNNVTEFKNQRYNMN